MLQQTQVKTVIPYFIKFVGDIPNLKVLSTSNEKKILKLWEGLGYYRRAKNLRKTAKIIIKNYYGKLPTKFEEIKKLPGIGEYTANALLALVYDQPRIPIDSNVKRVFSTKFNKNIQYGIVGIFLIFVFYKMIIFHPYQNLYFGSLFKKNIHNKFEIDYWGLSANKFLNENIKIII